MAWCVMPWPVTCRRVSQPSHTCFSTNAWVAECTCDCWWLVACHSEVQSVARSRRLLFGIWAVAAALGCAGDVPGYSMSFLHLLVALAGMEMLWLVPQCPSMKWA